MSEVCESLTLCQPEPICSIQGTHISRLSFALLQNGIPAVHAIEVNNTGEATLEQGRLVLSSSPLFFAEKEYRLPPIKAGEKYRIEFIELNYVHELFSRLTEAESGTLSAQLFNGERAIADTSFSIELLARNQWGGLGEFPETIAAFVQPNDPAVDRIWGQAVAKMREHDANTALDGYAQGKKEVWKQLTALWHTLLMQKIGYILPPASFEQQGQKIRNPSQILDAKLGTCLDISLFIASCLEQCGLNPLLVITKGHAFAGCWLSSSSFSTTIVDDVTALRKRLDLQEIIVFEATLLTKHDSHVSFQQACDHGSRNVREEVTSDFICLVDIARARMQRLRPLALAEWIQRRPEQLDATGSGGITENGNLEFDLEITKDFDDDVVSPASQVCETANTPQGRLERWQRKLLDLSLRNSLLNYRMGSSKRYVEILAPDPGALEDRLADGERFKLIAGLDLIKNDPRADKLFSAIHNEELLERLASELIKKGSLVTSLERKELDSRLTTLYRSARSTLEESGANTLYLAYGFLVWKPEGRDKPCRAPLILLPARLERHSVQSGFTLSLSDDEPRFNLTLLELLHKDYGIVALDAFAKELPADDHGLDIDGIWRTVQHAVKDIEGWEVSRSVGLGLFSFAKYLMWKDLAEHTALLKKNPVVSHLLSPQQAFPDDPPFMPTHELDTVLHPQDVYCPLLADSSQLSAIVSAAKGKDFVLIGPPGTGKSQTIANMIAQCLAENKTVLFVAEKTAALNVVYRRLKHIGLGEFCLELHSNKARKAEVLSQLSRSVDVAQSSSEDWTHAASRLVRTREQLNAYVKLLHQTYPNGLNAYRAMGIVVSYPEVLQIPLSWPSPEHHDREAYDGLFDIGKKLAIQGAHGRELGVTAFRYIRREDWSPLWEQELLEALASIRVQCRHVAECSQTLAAVCTLPFVDAEGETRAALMEVAELLPTAYGNAWEFALRPDANRIIAQLKTAIALLETYAEMWATLSGPYRSEAVDADIPALQTIWATGTATWWPKSFFLKRNVKNALRGLCGTHADLDWEQDLATLHKLREIKTQILNFEELSVETSGIFAAFNTDMEKASAAVTFAEELHRLLGRLAKTPEQLADIGTVLEPLLGPANMLLASDGSVGHASHAWVVAVRSLLDMAESATELMRSELKLSDFPASKLIEICTEISERKQFINTWCAWLRTCSEASALGLTPLVNSLVQGALEPSAVELSLRVNYARWWIVQVIEDIDVLRSFVPSDHERIVTDFKELDEAIRKMTCTCIRSRLRSADALASGAPGEWNLLQREMAKKRRHMPVRQLIAGMPTLLPQLTPCLLMSPLSIAQYLAVGQTMFDLVIFDEASQIPVWDAIGAMARGKKVIVVGDPKQLPPTNFFQKTDDAELDDDAYMEDDLESILEECIGAGLPRQSLRWHYRSRHESLITFSNQRYYDGGLVTFPSPDTKDKAVSLCFADGIYERGTSRTNPVEARMLVADLLERLRSPQFQDSGLTIGVVTFNSQQQLLIEDLLDAERRRDPSLDKFFDSDREEPVLVKNLENIQGDERDIMYFSIGFGPDQTGHITMNFGALNKDGGERRLNVAVTRARYELKVFCSLHPDQIQLTKTKARGVHDLRLFLEYAQQGVHALAANIHGIMGEYDSPFEQAVAEALQRKGWQTHPQVGVSNFRIDLGIVDPDTPGKYLAGVECDGYTYHRSATARDRDRLREGVLRGLGWEIVRIWSTEWWINRDAATEKLHTRLGALLEERRSRPNEENTPNCVAPALLAPSESSFISQNEEPETSRVTPVVLEEKARQLEQNRLRALIQTVVSTGSPIHEDALCRTVAKQMGFSRAGSNIRSSILSLATSMYEQSTEDVGRFFWDKGQSASTCMCFRKRNSEEICVVDEISMPELVALANSINPKYEEDPVVLLSRKLGLSRLRSATRPRLEKAWTLRSSQSRSR